MLLVTTVCAISHHTEDSWYRCQPQNLLSEPQSWLLSIPRDPSQFGCHSRLRLQPEVCILGTSRCFGRTYKHIYLANKNEVSRTRRAKIVAFREHRPSSGTISFGMETSTTCYLKSSMFLARKVCPTDVVTVFDDFDHSLTSDRHQAVHLLFRDDAWSQQSK